MSSIHYVDIPVYLFIYLLTQVWCVQVLAITKKTAINIHVQVFLYDLVFLFLFCKDLGM